jgi:hypothetical protein
MNSDSKAEKKARVVWFQEEILRPDPALIMIEHFGLEADDLIAAISLLDFLTHPIPLVGIDKDLLQLPKGFLDLRETNGTYRTYLDYAVKLPKAIQPWVEEPLDILLVLALLGDSSDSVPRLIPAHELHVLRNILMEKEPFTQAQKEFGLPFLDNLCQTVLPSPWCFEPTPALGEIPSLLESGEYYKQLLSESLRRTLTYGLARVTYHDVLHERIDQLVSELGYHPDPRRSNATRS